MYTYKVKLIFYFLFFFVSSVAFADTANITKLTITTEDQVVKPNQVSGEIIVQTQNSAGEAEKVSETNDISFSSSSGTGEFINASGNPVTTTMSRNTSSRTFFYRDSTTGTHILTIRITGRETGKSFSVTESISISSSNTTSGTASGSSESNSSSKSSIISSHSKQESASELKTQDVFKISAGRKRIVTINTPIEFIAESNLVEDKKKRNKFEWSFGDGTSGRGQVIDHIYKFPGNYIVVLNGVQGEKNAVARTEVKVIDPKIKIVEVMGGVDGYVTLENSSKEEVNIGTWIIESKDLRFVIAKDTIMYPESTLSIPLSVENNNISFSLYFPSGALASGGSGESKHGEEVVMNQALAEERTNILRQIIALKKQLDSQTSVYTPSVSVNIDQTVVQENTGTTTKPENSAENIATSSRESLVNILNQKETASGLNGVLHFFKSIFAK